ncbi:MAG TPA: iron-containing redox enzyme family protein [Kofleriaceae bacterium]|nr:iron-containing redox enzyme family protein [Kofleriaceae bacterium]
MDTPRGEHMTASPLPLTAEMIDAFRTIMTRTPAADFAGVRRRIDAATKLGTRAFNEGDRAAWEVVQVIEWRLQRNSSLRPTDPGDVYVLDTLYRIEEARMPAVELPRGLTPKEFCDKLTVDISEFSAVDSPTIALMKSGKLTRDDWHYLGYQWLAPSGDFCRMISIASLALPPTFARFMYHNLFDEAGKGVWERTHHYLLQQFLGQFGVETENEEELLAWTVPEHLAMINAQNRILWHQEPGWALGSMYLYERLLPFELAPIRDGLLALGIKEETLGWFSEHITVDVSHAEDWLGVVEGFLRTYDEQVIAYAAAIDRGRWARRSWDAIHGGWLQWKETKRAPHVPARELREATGL